MSLIRNENSNIKYQTIEKLCELFNIKLEELLIYIPYELKFDSYELKDAELRNIISDNSKTKSIYEKIYTVKKGDTLIKIAEKFGVEIEDLKRDNRLKSDKIFNNQLLKIIRKKINGYTLNLKFKVSDYEVSFDTDLFINKEIAIHNDINVLKLNALCEKNILDELKNVGFVEDHINHYLNSINFYEYISNELESRYNFYLHEISHYIIDIQEKDDYLKHITKLIDLLNDEEKEILISKLSKE
ncbi:LysM peptidoglycan-binding domain-containing protein [Macrococcoides bohemicum]|nr:LysM peptidoglycan-binding domain-containing protein [Macrococcus bohemicus]